MSENETVGKVPATWDLAEFIADRQMPEATVVVYLNEYASHAKAQLLKAHAKATGEEAVELDRQLDEVEKQLEASRYEIHLRAIPARMRQNIHSKALSTFPYKRNLLGQPSEDDPTTERINLENNLLWQACISKVVTPSGAEFENPTEGDIELLANGLPVTAQSLIDAQIRELHESAERFTAEVKNPDF